VPRTAFLPLALLAAVAATRPAVSPAQGVRDDDLRRVGRAADRLVRSELTTLWFPRSVDERLGGFHQNFARDWSPRPDADRFLVYQARMTWTAAAFAAYSKADRKAFEGHARRGVAYLDRVMRDRASGGFHWVVNAGGEPDAKLGTEKHVYGTSFALYAASEAYAVTRDEAARKVARDAFDWLETHAHDAEHGGYFEALTREGRPIRSYDDASPISRRTDRLGVYYGFKSMNAHIHLLEALAAFYRVERTERVKARLEETLAVVCDKIAVEPGALNLYLTRDWRAVPAHDSFGHDVETAYLIAEAAETLGRPDDPAAWRVARRLVDHALDWGWDGEHGGFYDKGEAFNGEAFDRKKVWWTQAEGLNALLVLHKKYRGETDRYGRAFLKQWDFIERHMIDPEHGGWFMETTREGKLIGDGAKATPWKAAYHTSRALMNVAALIGELTAKPADAPRAGGPVESLRPVAFTPLPLGSVRPKGWLEAQLRTQADGLSGHLDEFWPDIKESAWVGGKAEGWERTPYWLDGLVPLAYLLDDPKLKAKVKTHVDYILAHQRPDGWLGPVGDNDPNHKAYDVWPLFPLFKALTQYHEATGDPRVVPAMLRCCRKIDEVISKEPLYSWARYRAADLAVSLYWLHDRTSDQWLLDLAGKARAQAHDWRGQFAAGKFAGKTTRDFSLDNHGVNVGMAVKAPGVWWRLTGDGKDRQGVFPMLGFLDEHHGQATGAFTCDEHLAGRSPSQGTELCTVAEEMYSLETLLSIQGDPALGDLLEKLAFNAFPATFKKDMTAHQYDQQANQVVCKVSPEHVYVDNGPESNLYGLEPNFGCCTANMHQGWPKFTTHLWMASPDGGLAALSYAPCVVTAKAGETPVRVEVKSDGGYPFPGDNDRVRVAIKVKADRPVPLHLRIPGWAEGARCEVGGKPVAGVKAGTFLKLDRVGGGSKPETITLVFPTAVKLREGYQGAVSIERGPLVYALNVEGEWKTLRDRPGIPFDDFEVLPKAPWNYAIRIDRDHPERSVTFETRKAGDRPFTPEGAPVVARVKGRRLPGWTLEKNAAAPPPQSPVSGEGPLEELTLLPYGCTDLRVTEFPTLKP